MFLSSARHMLKANTFLPHTLNYSENKKNKKNKKKVVGERNVK